MLWKPNKLAHFPNLSLFVLFHHEWNAINASIKKFLDLYPDGDIIVARDTLEFNEKNKLIQFPYKLVKTYSCMQKFIDLAWDLKTEESLSETECFKLMQCHIQRLVDVADCADNEWILAIESDAMINKRVPILDFSDIDIIEVNKFDLKYISEIQKISGDIFKASGWGFVVGPIRKDLIYKIYKWFHSNPELISRLINLDKRIVVMDFFIVVASHFVNARITNSNLVTECLRNKFWRLSSRPLLHQYKPKKHYMNIRQLGSLAKDIQNDG